MPTSRLPIPLAAAAGTFGGGGGSGAASFDAFFSQPGGIGPWLQGLARLLAVAVILVGLLLVVRNLAQGRGVAAFKDLVGAVLASAVLSDLSLLGVVTDVAVKGVSLVVTTVSGV